MAVCIIEEARVSEMVTKTQETISSHKAKKREIMEFNSSTQKTLDLEANRGEIQKDDALQRQANTNNVEKKLKEQIEFTIHIQSIITSLETTIRELQVKLKSEDYERMLLEKDVGNTDQRLKLLMTQYEELNKQLILSIELEEQAREQMNRKLEAQRVLEENSRTLA